MRAIDDGRLRDLLGNRLHVVAQHEGRESGLKYDVDEHDPDVLVVQQPPVAEDRKRKFAYVDLTEHGNGCSEVDPVKRHDDDLRRQQVAGREDHQGREVEAPAELRACEGDHRRKQQREHDRGHGDDERVQVVVGQLGLAPDRLVVDEAQTVRGPGEISVLDRVADRP